MSERRHPLALRIPVEALEEIDRRASSAGLNRTEYMVRASLGEITDPRDAESRFVTIERRLERLERLVEIGGMQ